MQASPTGRLERSAAIPPLGAADATLLLVYAVFLFALSYVGSRGHMFWSDEIMGWMVIRADTWHQLFARWNAGIDSSGFLFYVFGRPWMDVFGHTEMSLRFFSAAGVVGAFGLAWLSARRFFRPVVVALALPLPFLLNPIMLWQLSNARSYGLVMLGTSLAAYAFVVTDPAAPDSPRRGRGLTFLSFLLMASSHILGPLYCFAFFCGFVVRDLVLRRVRLPLYLSAIAGLSLLPLSLKNIAATTAAGKPSFWTPSPKWSDFLKGFYDFAKPVGLFLFVSLLLFAVVWLLQRRKSRVDPLLLPEHRAVYAVLLIYAFIVVLDFAASKATTSIFWDRYLLPVAVANGLLLCELFSRVARPLPLRPLQRVALTCIAPVIAGGLWYYFAHVRGRVFFYPPVDNTAQVLAGIPPGQPVIVTDIEEFAEITHYADSARAWFTPLDWPVTLDPRSHGGASGMHSMEYWKSQGLHANEILPPDDLLQRVGPCFLVVSESASTLWFELRIRNNPAFTVTELPTIDLGTVQERVWRVQRRPSSP